MTPSHQKVSPWAGLDATVCVSERAIAALTRVALRSGNGEIYYNRKRRHSAIENKIPNLFEQESA